MDITKDFNSFYTKHLHKPSSHIDYYSKRISNSLTPYVLEERELRATQIDIFSRLMRERIIWVAGEVDDNMSTLLQAQLMFLDSVENKEISMHVDTPGGSVKSGLSIVDIMQYINSDIATVNTGIAASMGSVILGAGTKGLRRSLKFSRTMLHQSSAGFSGNIQDATIYMDEWMRSNDILFELLGEFCSKDKEDVKRHAQRDLWLTADEAVEYGIIDEVIRKKTNGGH